MQTFLLCPDLPFFCCITNQNIYNILLFRPIFTVCNFQSLEYKELLFKKQPTLFLSMCISFRLNEFCWSWCCSTSWKWFHCHGPPLSKDGIPLRIQIWGSGGSSVTNTRVTLNIKKKKTQSDHIKDKCRVTCCTRQGNSKLRWNSEGHFEKIDFILSGLSSRG